VVILRRSRVRGQAIAEAAIVLPALLLLSLAVLQAGLAGYAVLVARHAAHAGARAAVVGPAGDRARAARAAAFSAVAAAPGLLPAGAEITPRERGANREPPTIEVRMRVLAPRIVPLWWWPVVSAACRLPLEPEWAGDRTRRR
jgi:hypothetical protein